MSIWNGMDEADREIHEREKDAEVDRDYEHEPTGPAARCYVCGRSPHEPDADHVLWSEVDADAWHARQPSATPPPLVVDGQTISYTS